MRGSRIWFGAAAVATLLGIAPLLSVVIASAIAGHYGCRLDEGDIHSCIVAGRDIGGTLYTMGIFGWMMLFSIWPLLASPVLWIVGFVTLRRERRSRSE